MKVPQPDEQADREKDGTPKATLIVTDSNGAVSCVIGGLLADKFGKRLMIAIYAALTIVPNLVLAGWMISSGTDFTLSPKAAGWAAPRSRPSRYRE